MCGYYNSVAIIYHKLFQALINELSSYDASIEEVEEAAQELLDMEHFASDTIEEQRLELKRKWKELKTLAARRTQKLCDALEAQKVRIQFV